MLYIYLNILYWSILNVTIFFYLWNKMFTWAFFTMEEGNLSLTCGWCKRGIAYYSSSWHLIFSASPSPAVLLAPTSNVKHTLSRAIQSQSCDVSSLPSTCVNVKSMYHINTWLNKGFLARTAHLSSFSHGSRNEMSNPSVDIFLLIPSVVSITFHVGSQYWSSSLDQNPKDSAQYLTSYVLSHTCLLSAGTTGRPVCCDDV